MTRKILMAMLFIATTVMVVAGCGGDGKTSNGGGNKAAGDGGEDYTRPEVPAEYKDREKPEFTDEMVAEGEKIYRTNCETCHGKEGKGDGPAGQALTPPAQDLTNPDLQAAISDHYIFWRVHVGGAPRQSGMTAFEGTLSDEQIWQVTAFIRSLVK